MTSTLMALDLRIGQLAAWLPRLQFRLNNVPPHVVVSKGATHLLSQVWNDIGKAEEKLAEAKQRLSLTQASTDAHPDDQLMQSVVRALISAETLIIPTETRVLPVLLGRTPTDPLYDAFVDRFLADLRIPNLGCVTWHKDRLQLMAVDYYFITNPIFSFSPSLRSFESLALLYHEIGHFAWRVLFSPAERDEILAQMDYSANAMPLKLDARAIGEIIADAFAGLAGGYAYLTNFCSFHIGKPDIRWHTGHYLSPLSRVDLVRRACIAGGAPIPPGDPFLSCWESRTSFPDSDSGDSKRAPDPNVVDSWLALLRDAFAHKGVPLCGGIPEVEFTRPVGPSIMLDMPVPTILLAASKFKATCQSWEAYARWQRAIFHELGLLHGSHGAEWII